jgi:isopentenyl diphosphate isomerase/L-lactate dehydrogenase-like FMN-dependent dehydrogenase
MARLIVDRLTRQSADAVLSACLADDGVGAIDPTNSVSVDHALHRVEGIVRFSIALDRPLVGLGASAPVYYPAIAAMLGAEPAIPADAGVANAVGAVVGQVRSVVTTFVTMPEEDVFVVAGGGESVRFPEEAEAFSVARERAMAAALASARASGADEPVVTLSEEIDAPEIKGHRKLIEARFRATASGRPRIAEEA